VSKIERMGRRLAVLVMLGSGLAACGTSREGTVIDADKVLTAQAQGDFQKIVAEGDELWKERKDRAKLEQAIAKWEESTTVATPDMSEDQRRKALGDVYQKVSRGYYFLADSHIRTAGGDPDATDEQMKEVFNKGVLAAEKGLGVYSKEFAQEIRQEKPWPEAIKVLDDGAVPLLYWYATNIGKWALLEGFTEILSRKEDIKAIMDRVEAKDPTYFHGAPMRYFGAYYTKLPFPGGDLPKSEEYFKKAIAADPNYLATRVLFAENYATKMDNKELYREHLEFVLKFDLSQAPDLLPENHFEQIKAKAMLDKIDDTF
jgi:tetratricopeptide (TPR) repeat protein